MTTLLFRLDPYMKEFDALVTRVEDGFIVLDRTCFFPQGGGQAGDIGKISSLNIVNTLSEGDDVYHITERAPEFTVGKKVHGILDWQRRFRIMRLHSASHLLYYAMQEVFGSRCKPASSGMLDELKDRSDYLFDEPILREKLSNVEERVNKLIIDELPIMHYPEVGSEEKLIWKIEPFPPMACGGTHVRNTGEIGRVSIKRGSKPGKGRERIELILVPEILRDPFS